MIALVVALACGPMPGDDEPTPTESAPAAPARPLATTPLEAAPPVDATAFTLTGTWWALAPSLPFMALRMDLVETGSDGVWEGNWITFDWRASADGADLARRSRPVTIAGRSNGEDGFVITGPSPQIDASGNPNGNRGRWELTVKRSSLPGEPLRLSGLAVHTELTDREGVAVELSRHFRAWAP